MGSVIVIEFVTLDSVISDPEGLEGTPYGGWAFRHGEESVAGDKFRLGPLLKDAVLLLGRTTWERFTEVWPGREDAFSQSLNAMEKAVVSSSLTDVSKWENSELVKGDLGDYVRREREVRDIVVAGSLSVVRQLQREGLVDEYRLLTFPSVAGTGARLFAEPADLTLVSADKIGAAVLTRYERVSS